VAPDSFYTVNSYLYTVLLCYTGFPNAAVVDAYIHPTVDESMEPFTWSSPDIERLREYPCIFPFPCNCSLLLIFLRGMLKIKDEPWWLIG